MNAIKLTGIAIACILLIWFIFAVGQSVDEAKTPCEEQSGSVCTSAQDCPNGFVEAEEFVCYYEGQRCCLS